MDVTGVIKRISETETVSDKFKKREFVLMDNSSQYPQFISFQLTQDKCNLLDNFSEGETIKVHFNLRGREFTTKQGEIKYFNTLEAWRIEKGGF
jgi:single-strand DNA-binding protein